MATRKIPRALLAAATGIATVVASAPEAAAQQNQCVQPGTTITAAPWSQQLLAPERAWPMTTGAGQKVAVLSTGTGTNPLLQGKIAAQTSVAPGESGGGSSGKPDCLGIGTGVAGLIVGQRVTGIGFHGVAPDAQLLSVKVAGDEFPQGLPTNSVMPETLASGINWAVDHGATVIAVPTISYLDSDALRAAVQRALNANIVVVAATGERDNNETLPLTPYPAAYDGVIGVGSIGENGELAQNSRAQAVDIVAPGENVVTTYPDGGLGAAVGTGFATAYVAGSVALVRSYRPQLSNQDVERRLLAAAAPAPEGAGSASYGYGVLNPYAAVVDNVTDGTPAAMPAYQAPVVDQAEKAREDAENSSARLAYILAAAGAALAALLVGAIAFGPRGRNRRWRGGLAAAPVEHPEDELPEPPAQLFADRP
ncbi:S8 family serine peptidase [Amycolatopsis acidicola]|uniref:S8 family serine peptidase n=1 Tax=Amycolatopsis acidicola TaxID=2596893 RepID=A0A5N0V4V2_9PSEU|nr:S8 family serine peptidase [Amycolatopsis acidicola]KAA9160150.1 S8 family serine peptidase [Amycolatopsis acidicola]